MALRRFLRGQVSWPRLESVFRAVSERYGDGPTRVEFLEADNWLSVPAVVDDRLFVKVISEQHALLQTLLTAGRNVGAFSRGVEGFFEPFETPGEMAAGELDAVRRMHDRGINVPEPVEAFEHDGLGVLVVEYLPGFRTVDELSPDRLEALAGDVFRALREIHEAGLAHGDVRAENVLVLDGEVYFIDATNLREDPVALADAAAYDLACTAATLAARVGARPAVTAALEVVSVAELLEAREFLDFVNMRPDHDFDAAALRSEIESAAG
jgi:hypothetical protein